MRVGVAAVAVRVGVRVEIEGARILELVTRMLGSEREPQFSLQ